MKILHISNYFYPHIGGIEQVARDCMNALAGSYEQRLFCFNSEREDSFDTVGEFEIVRAGIFATVSSQSLSFSYGKLLKQQFETFCPDVVIFHYPNPFAAHYLLKLLKKHPECTLILWWHLDIFKQKFLKLFFNGQMKRLLKRAKRIVATSPNYIEGSKPLSANREKCRVIPNCADSVKVTADERDGKEAEKIRARHKGKTILFALGRHVPYKGTEYLIRASKLLGENYAVLIGGEGPLTPSLKELARGDGKIEFLGKLSDADCKANMLACDIFCFPSVTKNEAFGLALVEAMAFSKPSVTFHIEGSGVNFVSLDGITGIETENGNAAAYAEAIERLASDEALRRKYGEAAKKRVEECFTEVIFREKLQALLREISADALSQ